MAGMEREGGMKQPPRTFRFVDNLPAGATVICWNGRLLIIWPQDGKPPPVLAMKAIPHAGTVA